MDPGNHNPYAPPETSLQPIEATSRRWPQGSGVLSLATGVYALGFVAFTLLLLGSTPADRAVGKYFLLNIPTLIALVVYIRRSRRLGAFVGVTFVCLQCALTIPMFRINSAEWLAVVVVNGIVIAPIMAIALLAWAFDFLANSKSAS
jgi:hypothetical protein